MAFIWARQLPYVLCLRALCSSGRMRSGNACASSNSVTPSTYCTFNPVNEAANEMESRLFERDGKLMTKIFWNCRSNQRESSPSAKTKRTPSVSLRIEFSEFGRAFGFPVPCRSRSDHDNDRSECEKLKRKKMRKIARQAADTRYVRGKPARRSIGKSL